MTDYWTACRHAWNLGLSGDRGSSLQWVLIIMLVVLVGGFAFLGGSLWGVVLNKRHQHEGAKQVGGAIVGALVGAGVFTLVGGWYYQKNVNESNTSPAGPPAPNT